MNYEAAIQYLNSFADYEKVPALAFSAEKFDLRRVEELLSRLGNPHCIGRVVHLAGTKGKGSTAAMIASVLQAGGYKVGLFTSPHLHSFCERVAVNGQPILEESFARLATELAPHVQAVNQRATYGRLTTFEIITSLAFAHFRDEAVDFQVLETGLGGRLDATNVVSPEVCVITSISLDHTTVLGDSLSQIAREKSGIIKPGCLVVCAPQSEEVTRVIGETCLQRRAEVVWVEKELSWRRTGADLAGQSFVLASTGRSYSLRIPLLGTHQLENAATAVAALEAVGQRGTSIDEESIRQGLASVRWPGRLEVLRRCPLVVADGAHNSYSAQRLAQALGEYFGYKRLILVLGTSVDKDLRGIVDALAPLAQEVIVTHSRNPRAVAPEVLAAKFARFGIRPYTEGNVSSAVSRALDLAEEDDLICVTGSLFVVAEAREAVGVDAKQVASS